MKTQTESRPRVTIVMTARERHSLAIGAIENIVGHTTLPYRFIYADVQSPAWLRESLALRSNEWGLEVVRFEEPLWPQEARSRLVGMIDTDYVVFIDNDVRVEDHWLEALVACADQTGAGIVGPLYLMGGGTQPNTIHMAGGKLTEAPAEGGRILEDVHLLKHADPEQVADKLFRQPCDFAEYHCMMVRGELLRDCRLLDPCIRCVHEHIDTAFSVKQRGYPIFFEPSARVTYLAFADYMLDELPLFRNRWSREAAAASIDAFCKKWSVVNDNRSFGSLWEFLRAHRAEVDPIRTRDVVVPDRLEAMRREELKQTRSDLLDLAIERGYEPQEVAWIAHCYHVAHILSDGGYRPCGRPFINHLAGTASVLIRYDFRTEIVGAGLLHSAYTHCSLHQAGPKETGDFVCAALGGKGSALEKRVRAYTKRRSNEGVLRSHCASSLTVSVADAEVIALATANLVDMYLSGEVRYSGRTDGVEPFVNEQTAHVCQVFGVDGLAQTLLLAQRQPIPVKPELVTRIPFSYRVGPDKQSAVRMASNTVATLE